MYKTTDAGGVIGLTFRLDYQTRMAVLTEVFLSDANHATMTRLGL